MGNNALHHDEYLEQWNNFTRVCELKANEMDMTFNSLLIVSRYVFI